MELIVLKINDIDISYVEKNEALQMFLDIEEPFLLEVRRRKTGGTEVDVAEGLEALQLYKSQEEAEEEEEFGKRKASINQIVLSIKDTIQSSSFSRQTQTVATDDVDDDFALEHLTHVNVDKIVEDEHHIFEQCLEPEIDVEEITLRKSNSNEHLGLTVCYSPICGSNGTIMNNNIGSKPSEDLDQCAEVYISDIHPNSVAGRDGRLRPGDQILQINGKDIKSKEDTEALIAENNNAVTLLVSRYLYGDEEYFNEHCSGPEVMNSEQEVDTYDDDINNELCDVHSYITYENKIVTNKSANTSDLPIFSEMNSSKSTFNEWKGSGEIPITLKSCQLTNHEEKINQSSGGGGIQSEQQAHTFKTKELNVDRVECLKETEHIYETIPEYSDNEPFYSSPYEFSSTIPKNVSNFKSSSSILEENNKSPEQKQRVAQWLGIKNHVCGRFLPRPKEVLTSNFLKAGIAINIVPSNACSSSSNISTVACNSITPKLNFNDDHDNSSSAYNSGGSNNSVIPCNMPVQIIDAQFQPSSNDTMRQSGKDNTYTAKKSKELQLSKVKALTNLKPQMHHPSGTKMFNTTYNNLVSHKSVSIESSHNKPEPQQFTAPNLSQYHFVSSQEVSSIFNSPNVADPVSHSLDTHQEQMVWKVKRRADGSRYIVRRPVRKYILKERTFRLNGLPCDGTTTEDDTVSEVKLGRYWSKEDRKKHIERAKERRQQSRNTETILKPSFRKRPSKNISGDPSNSNIADLPAKSFSINQPRFFKLQFNSKNDSLEKLPKNKEPIPLNSVDIDIEKKIFTESMRDIDKNSANLSITPS